MSGHQSTAHSGNSKRLRSPTIDSHPKGNASGGSSSKRHRVEAPFSEGHGTSVEPLSDLITALTMLVNRLNKVPLSKQFKAAIGETLQTVRALRNAKENESHIKRLHNLVDQFVDHIIKPYEEGIVPDRTIGKTIDFLTGEISGITAEHNGKTAEVRHCLDLSIHTGIELSSELSTALEQALELYKVTINKKDIRDVYEAVETNTETMHDATRRIEGYAVAIQQGISGMDHMLHEFTLSQEEQKLLDQLPRVEAQYNTASRSATPSCLENTRVALLDEIYQWIRDPNSEQKIYWLHGLAGTGKSTIAHTVASKIDEEKCLGASFFFSRDEADLRDPLVVIPTIVHQLADFNPRFEKCLAKSLAVQKRAGTAALPVQADVLLIAPFREMGAQLSASPSPTIVVMDAMDECDNHKGHAKSLLKLILHFLLSFPDSKFKILMTSRPEPHIETHFTNPSTNRISSLYTLHNIESSIVRADIEVFLDHELREVANTSGRLDVSIPWPSTRDFKELVDRAGTLFIVAATIVKFICDPDVRQPKEQLRALLTNTRATDASPYADLDQLYHHVLSTSVGRFKGTDDFVCKRFREVVGAIIMVLDPVTPTTLQLLLNRDIEYIAATVELLHSVIIVPSNPASESETLRVFHLSFPNFLTDSTRCSDPRFTINPIFHHSRLALHCLRIMNGFLRRDICGLPKPLAFNDEIPDLEERLSKAVLPHHRYACKYWGLHLKATLQPSNNVSAIHDADDAEISTMRSEILEMFTTFCKEKLLQWLEVLSLLGWSDIGLTNLKAADEWLKWHHTAHTMLTMLSDAQRLIQRSFESIQHCASHIYHSALAFAPECMLYDNYKAEIERSGRVLQGRESAWNSCITVIYDDDEKYFLYTGVIVSLAFSDDGSQIVSACSYNWNSVICIWDATTGSLIKKISPRMPEPSELETNQNFYFGPRKINSVAFSHDGTRIVSGNAWGAIEIWDAVTGSLLKELNGKAQPIPDYVSSVAFSYDDLLILSTGSTGLPTSKNIYIWNAATGCLVERLPAAKGAEDTIEFSHNHDSSSHVIIVSQHEAIPIYTIMTGPNMEIIISKGAAAPLQRYGTSGSTIRTILKYGPNSKSYNVEITDLMTNTVIAELCGHVTDVTSAAFSRDNSYIVSGSEDGTIRIWDAKIACQNHILKKSDGPINLAPSGLAFTSDGLHILSRSVDGTFSIWDSASGSLVRKLDGFARRRFQFLRIPMMLSNNGLVIILGEYEDDSSVDLTLWDTLHEACIKELRRVNTDNLSEDSGSESSDISEDIHVKAHGDMQQLEPVARCLIKLWDLSILDHNDRGNQIWHAAVAFSCDQLHVAAVGNVGGGILRAGIWDASTGFLIKRFNLSFSTLWEIKEASISCLKDVTNYLSGMKKFESDPGKQHLISAVHSVNVQRLASKYLLTLEKRWVFIHVAPGESVRLCHIPFSLIAYEFCGYHLALGAPGGIFQILDFTDMIKTHFP